MVTTISSYYAANNSCLQMPTTSVYLHRSFIHTDTTVYVPYSRDNKHLFEKKHVSKIFENKHAQKKLNLCISTVLKISMLDNLIIKYCS